ncbi:nuclear pore membrane glycoprotein 210 [Plutella xylostella]|uniref:nuclear pore membrane glycoprotein 210 n=1 Tax=Plutella xylostella TaxID=51655 RepID=UPI002032C57B|nr:nuclear pore membrane glycoprotein 210 [Plutella xylostella]
MFPLRNKLCLALILYLYFNSCDGAKINTPRVLLPWFPNLYVNFTFEINEGGCYTWSLSRDDIIDIEPLYEDSWGHCSRAARVSVSKTCVPPGSVIILAEETNTGEVLRGDVDIDVISSLKVMSTTWKLYLEEAPEAFEVVAYDDQGNTFSTLEGLSFKWTIENTGKHVGEEPLVMLVKWSDTDYEAPQGVTELESKGFRSYTTLLYGQAMGECRVHVCLEDVCTDFNLHVVASVVLTPAVATIAPGDTLRYRVVRAKAGRLTVQDVADTLYNIKLPSTSIASLEDTISLVRGSALGTTQVMLYSGVTEVASAVLVVAEPHSIRVTLRPSNLVISGEVFTIHCVVLDKDGHMFTAGDEMLIRLTVGGEANVDLLRSTENGTITEAVARNAGPLLVNAKLFSVAGKSLSRKVEGHVSGVAVEPLAVVPPEIYVAWTEATQDVALKHRGGGDEAVSWSESDEQTTQHALSLSNDGLVTVRGVGHIGVKVHLKQYPYVKAYGRVLSAVAEYMQVSGSGRARVAAPHPLHVALTGTHPETGELFNFHRCDCASFSVTLLEGPEPQNVTAATWIQPVEGACCVLQVSFSARGVSVARVWRGRSGDTARVVVREAPSVVWPVRAAMLVGASLPVLAQGESLVAQSNDHRTADLMYRDGMPPHRHPDLQLFTVKCQKKGETKVSISSQVEDEESAVLETVCAAQVAKIRLEPVPSGNCSGGPRLWLRPGQEAKLKVSLFDAVGRELLDERGPKVSWELSPTHVAIEYRAVDRLLIETHPEYAPVPVPLSYYQIAVASEQAVGWSGTLKASIPDATASIQAKVVAPLMSDSLKVNLAFEGETVTNIATITGGSGRYAAAAPTGVTARVDAGKLHATVPGPGTYDIVVSDLCVPEEKVYIEVNIEEILSVEVSAPRAVCVGSCVPITALVKGTSHRYLRTSPTTEWRASGDVIIKGDKACGVREGAGRVAAGQANVWSEQIEMLVFPPLGILPSPLVVAVGGRVQTRRLGGPPAHLATFHYDVTQDQHVKVSPSGVVHGLSIGTAKIVLTARDINNIDMTSAEAVVEVVAISSLRVLACSDRLLVGAPCPLRVSAEAGGAALSGLRPPPALACTLAPAAHATLHLTHRDDHIERSAAEGLTMRVVALKPGLITINCRVRNMGQWSETRIWDSTIEILAISEISAAVEGSPQSLAPGDRIDVAVGSTIRLKATPRSEWSAYNNEGVFELSPSGELRALQPGFGIAVAQNRDERNDINRQQVIQVQVSVPHYSTAQPSTSDDEHAIRVVLRDSVGRELLAPDANVSVYPPVGIVKRAQHSALGSEIILTNVEAGGTYMTFESSVSGVTVKDEVWVAGPDQQTERIVASVGSVICLEGAGWRGPASAGVLPGSAVSASVPRASGVMALRADRPSRAVSLRVVPANLEFQPGDWPSTLVPLTTRAQGLSPDLLVCTEQQRLSAEELTPELPITCRTHAPHTAEPIVDFVKGQVGCTIIPGFPILDAADVELCAESGAAKTCTRVTLLPQISVSTHKVSLLNPPTEFSISGHPRALKHVKVTPSPGLKLETTAQSGDIRVEVKSEDLTCGFGWVNVVSKLTGQELRVEVEKECDVACGTLLGALFSLIKPYLSTLVTIGLVFATYLFIQSKLERKATIKMPMPPSQSVLPPANTSTPLHQSTWSRSPYASGPAAPIYGDASMLPDSSFSPTNSRTNSRFL